MSRRAVIYTRISSDRAGAGLGVACQLEDCEELAARLGWELVDTYSDNDISAYSGAPRPGYRALLDDLRAGRATAVLAWHTDRLHRSPRELEEYIDVCEPRGVITYTVKAGDVDLSTSTGRAVARTLGAWARQESEQKSERIRRQKAQAAAAGGWRGGPRPYGFEADGVTVKESEARHLRRAATDLLGGRSLVAVTREANAAGARTVGGKPLTTVALRRSLLRPRTGGLIEHRGEVAGVAQWPAIVPPDTWRAVVALLSDPGRRTNTARGNERRWLLSGLALCGLCSSTVRVVVNGQGARAYACDASPAHVSRSQPPLDDLVQRTVVERLNMPDAIDLLASDPDTGPLQAAQEAAAALRVREDDLASMFAAGDVSAGQLKAGTERLRSERERVEGEVVALSGQLNLAWLSAAPDAGEAFLSAPLDKRRAVVDALLSVTILKGKPGRLPGWRPGDPPRIDPRYVRLEWRS